MRVRAPTLRILSGLTSPLLLPGAVLLPHWAEGLDVPQQRAMLAQELAHLCPRDPLWRLLQRLAWVPLFFHPLAWYAPRRLETLAERCALPLGWSAAAAAVRWPNASSNVWHAALAPTNTTHTTPAIPAKAGIHAFERSV